MVAEVFGLEELNSILQSAARNLFKKMDGVPPNQTLRKGAPSDPCPISSPQPKMSYLG